MRISIFFALLLVCPFSSSLAGEMKEPDLNAIPEGHPRLLVEPDAFERLKTREWDNLGQRFWHFFEKSADTMLETEPVERVFTGRRLLQQSRKALKRITTWSLLYRVNGDERYRDRAILEMEAISAFSDWNPSHYLDVGEMALALAIGTDWLWDDLTESQRARYLEALKTKGILPSLDESHPDNWWIYYYNNWNPVCHSGIVAAAILLADKEPELSKHVIERAIQALPEAMEAYKPVGAYPEGPAYWDYGTAFTAILLDLLKTAFGTSFGLDEDPAFRNSGTYRAVAVTPTGIFYNYADCGPESRFAEATAWFASRYDDAAARYELQRGLKEYLDAEKWTPTGSDGRVLPFVVLWYPESEYTGEAELPNIWLGKGPNPVAFVREGWNDRNDVFLGFKGNDGSVSHAHLDAGSFIFEDEGVRWAIDLGHQSYTSLEQAGLGIWDRRQHADRWRIFRLGPYAHNVLLIDQRQQVADRKAEITQLEDEDGTVQGIVDLTPVYAGQADYYARHFQLRDNKVLQIIDVVKGARERTEQQGRRPATLRWRMLTRAEVTLQEDGAILRQDGKTLYLKVKQPAEFRLRAGPIDPPPHYWDETNPGVTAIDIWTKANLEGDQTVEVLMGMDLL